MFEKIKAKLLQQRPKNSHVSDRSLEDLARSLENIITTDEALEKANFVQAIESLDGNINHYTAEQVKAIQEKEKADKEKQKKEAEEKAKKEKETKKMAQDLSGKVDEEEIPAWAKQLAVQNQALLDQNNKLSNAVLQLQTDKIVSTRKQQLSKVLEGVPDFMATPIMKSFESTNFADELEFSQYLETMETTKKDYFQQAGEKGLNTDTPKKGAKELKDDGQTSVLKSAMKVVNEQKEKESQKQEKN